MRKLATGAAGSEVQNNKKAQSKVNTTEPRRTPKPMRSCSGSIEKFERLRGKWQRLFPWLTASASSEDKMWGVGCSVCKHAWGDERVGLFGLLSLGQVSYLPMRNAETTCQEQGAQGSAAEVGRG